MNPTAIIQELERNLKIFFNLLNGLNEEEYLWKPEPAKWCQLEIICHLYDEEREDFRTRVKHVLDNPVNPLSSIDPQTWVTQRNYMSKGFSEMIDRFCEERAESIKWLQSLESPEWDNAYQHPKLGPLSGKLLLANWLEHDYLHIRQIITLKHNYLKHTSGEALTYAGNW